MELLKRKEEATFYGIHYCKKHKTSTKWMDRFYNPFCNECMKEAMEKKFKESSIEVAERLTIKDLQRIINKKVKV